RRHQSRRPPGCAPTAFASLLWRDWVDGETYLGLTYEEEEPPTGPIEHDPSNPPPGDGPIPIYCRGNPRVCSTVPFAQSASDRYDRSPDGLLAALMRPSSKGVPLLSPYMGACYFVSGSMTTPGGFTHGA